MSKQNKNGQYGFRRKPLIVALESRILLDGAAVATSAEALSDVALQADAVHGESAEQSMHFAAPAPTASEAPARREVAFIDTSVDDYSALLSDLPEGVEAILIDGEGSGLEQMVTALHGRTDIDAIHLFSHGDVGQLKLGNLTLNDENLNANAELLSALGQSLAETGDLMLYGCYVGADSEGRSFIDAIAELTQADVAASEDLTGAERLGGDWELEAESGGIETLELSSAAFEGVLAPTVSAVADSVTFTEGGDPITIDAGITFTGGGDYREGYIRFTVENPAAGDQFVLQDAADVNTSGAISLIGTDVYLGNGTSRERIGSVDSVENGVNGQPLKILLSSPLPNSGFEEGEADWTLSDQRYGDGAGEINFDNFAITLANNSDVNLVYSGGTGITNVQSVDPGSSFSPADSSTWFQASVVDGAGVSSSKALYLTSEVGIERTDQAASGGGYKVDGYGSVHGPYATSSVISVENGDSISLDFKAVGSGDDYEVFGMLRRVDAAGNFLSDDVNDAANIILFAERGADTSGFVRVDSTGLAAGNYRFQFVGGTYDASGGLKVGSNLYVDNIRLISSQQVTDSIAGQIASQVTYQSTADDTEVERDITIAAMDSAGAVGSDTITLKVTQRNNAPEFSGDGSLAPVNEDTIAPAGSTVGNLFDSLLNDPDTSFTPADFLAGVIVTGDSSDPAEGRWEYSSDGITWHALGNVASDSGLLLSRDSSLRFVPAADYNGTPGGLSVHAVDSTDPSTSFTNGSTRETFDTTAIGATGGDTAVSASAVNLSTSISAVDDAPTLVQPTFPAVDDTDLLDIFTDVTGTLSGSDIDTPQSELRYGIQGGQSLVEDVALVGAYGTLRVVKATGEYTYTPTSDAINALSSAQTDSFTVTVSDGTTTVTKTLAFNINGANDAPIFGTVTTVDDTTTPPDLSGGVAPEAGAEVLDNGLLRFGSNAQDSINAVTGMLEQPFYYDDGNEYQLTYSNYALNLGLGVNGDGTSDWNLNGDVNLFPSFTNITVDTSGFNGGSGTLIWRGEITINGAQLALTHVYELPADSAYVETRTYVTNIGAAAATNLRVWVGTRDDFIAGTDSPAKQKGNLVGGAFEVNTAVGQQGQAVKVYSGDTAVLFYSAAEKADTIIAPTYGWGLDSNYSPGIDPSQSVYEQAPDDGGYAMYIRMEDLAVGETQSFDWFYAAGSTQQIDAIIADVSAAASANLVEGSGQLVETGEYTVSDVDAGDVVTLSPTAVTAGRIDAQGNPMALGSSVPDQATLLAMLSVTPSTVVDAASTSGTFAWNFDAGTEGFNFLGQGETLKLSYTLTAEDAGGATATQLVEVVIEGVNDAPVAQGGVIAVGENEIFNGNASATDVDGSIAGFELVTTVGLGTLNFNSDGSYSFNPGTAFDDLAAGETRSVTFSYRAVDNNGAFSQTATVTLDVTGSNDVPVVSADSGVAAENGTLSSSVPAASDVDGSIGSYQLVTDVTAGSLTFSTDGSYTFNAGNGFDDLAVGESRQVTFSYTATDNDGGVSAPGTVTLTITGTNDAPTISAEAAAPITEVGGDSSAQDLNDTGQISFNDLDTTDVVDITFANNNDISWSGGALSDAQKLALLSGFSVPVTTEAAAPGSVDWTYALNDMNLDFLAAGETVSFSYTVTATDSQGATATDTVTFSITGTNDAPTITAESADPIFEVGGDSSAQDLTDTGVISFADLDVTDVVDISFADNGDINWSGGSLTEAQKIALLGGFSVPVTTDAAAPGNVDWAYALNDMNLDFLAAGETLTFSYTVTANDSQGAIATDVVSFSITGTNDAPTIVAESADPIAEVGGDSSEQDLSDTGQISFNDLDVSDVVDITFADNNDISWSGGSLTEAQKSALVNGFSVPVTTDAAAPGNVDWTYAVNDMNLDFLAAGETLTFSYTVTATDSQGAIATDTVTFSITGTNDAPTITAESADPITEVRGDSSAQDLADTGVISFNDLDVTDVVDISFADNSDISWSGGSLTESQKTALLGGFSVPVTTDAAAPGSVDWTYALNDMNLDFLAAGETLTFSYTVTATDSQGATATDVVSFSITGTNDAPTIVAESADPFAEVGGDSSEQDLSDTGQISFNDLDTTDVVDITFADNGDINWSGGTLSDAQRLALLSGFSVPATTDAAAPGNVDWTYALNDMSLDFLATGETLTFSYTVTATDSQGGTATDTVSFIITGTNDAPIVTSEAVDVLAEVDGDSSAQDLRNGGRISFDDLDLNDTLSVVAAGNGDLTWRAADGSVIAGLPADLAERLLAGFSVSQPTGAEAPGGLDWKYAVEDADLDFLATDSTISFSYTVTVRDDQGMSSSTVINLVICGTNDGPVTDAVDIDQVWQLGRPFELNVAQRFSDADRNEALTYSVSGLPRGLEYDPASGLISGASTEPGEFTVVITATDAQGASISRTFGMAVTVVVPEADAPAAAPSPLPLPSTTPTAPVTTGEIAAVGNLNPGLIQTGPLTSSNIDGIGFMPPGVSDAIGGSGDEVDTSVGAQVVGGPPPGSATIGANSEVLLSERGTEVVVTTGPDGRTSVRAAVDVSVGTDGIVSFSDAQQEAFSIVGLAVSGIDQTDTSSALVRIQDSNAATSLQEYTGSLGSGESLPAWITVDRNTGAVSITAAPDNVREVVIRVQALGSDGQVRILELKLDLDELFRRAAAQNGDAPEQLEDVPETGFVPLQGQFEAEMQARDDYGDQLLRLLQSS
ncbi:VCBS domain-containing protein [Halopseudomonas sp.]|uniref:VCBS domain-containing protein n=1 Tax=Halopseudomonas sp. TaxID=2901191 RepID=UPI003002EC6D